MRPPTLKINDITLRAYDPEDEDRFVETALDPLVIKFMDGSTGDEMEERKLFKKIIEHYRNAEKKRFWIWGIYKSGQLCGHLEVKETVNTKNGELEIVYLIHPDERRKGIMTKILSLLKTHQKNWGSKMIATVHFDNLASIALLKKWGICKQEVLIARKTGRKYLKLTLNE